MKCSCRLTRGTLLLLFLKLYIRPLFDYCDIVWSRSTKSEVPRLETLLNNACRTVLCKRRGSLASAAHRELWYRRQITYFFTAKCSNPESVCRHFTMSPRTPHKETAEPYEESEESPRTICELSVATADAIFL